MNKNIYILKNGQKFGISTPGKRCPHCEKLKGHFNWCCVKTKNPLSIDYNNEYKKGETVTIRCDYCHQIKRIVWDKLPSGWELFNTFFLCCNKDKCQNNSDFDHITLNTRP